MADPGRGGEGTAGGPPGAMPGAAFGAGAAAGLAPVAREVEAAKGNAASGSLRMSEESARELLASLAEIQAKVHRMIKVRGADLTEPLAFGDNFVGRALSERLEGAASDGTRAAIPVLEQFSDVLETLEVTVRFAAGLFVAQDENAQEQLNKITAEFGETAVNRDGAW